MLTPATASIRAARAPEACAEVRCECPLPTVCDLPVGRREGQFWINRVVSSTTCAVHSMPPRGSKSWREAIGNRWCRPLTQSATVDSPCRRCDKASAKRCRIFYRSRRSPLRVRSPSTGKSDCEPDRLRRYPDAIPLRGGSDDSSAINERSSDKVSIGNQCRHHQEAIKLARAVDAPAPTRISAREQKPI